MPCSMACDPQTLENYAEPRCCGSRQRWKNSIWPPTTSVSQSPPPRWARRASFPHGEIRHESRDPLPNLTAAVHQEPTMLKFRHVREEELDAFWDAMSVAFAFDRDKEDEDHIYKIFEKDRMIAAFDESHLVGTFGAFSLNMTVPGGALPTAGTTIVTVLPTHRRSGALTGMMNAHFDEVIDKGEPLAALWASEAPIYGRFGYGAAADEAAVEISSDRISFEDIDREVSVRIVGLEDALTIFPPIFEAFRLQRAGTFVRSADWWRHKRLRDPKEERRGATAQRLAVAYRGEDPVGYIQFRTKDEWSRGGVPIGAVTIDELIGIDVAAELALWNFIANMDLMTTVKMRGRPIDDPLLWTLVDPRHLSRTISDGLWVRVMDVPAALSGRRY
ncbi:MAG TPA: GNAT family N-acetyltransferase, partial [Actinobacteria bacterium]|nr:GNAT family N-acetyltransferase [Actinomycetota bacterium]